MKRILVMLVLMGAILLSACGGATPAPAATEAAVAVKAPAASVAIEGAWGRPSPKVATAGAFYMVIKNGGTDADKLTGASSDACGTMELHESYMDDNGAMAMRPVEGGAIEIPAGGMVELKPGGLHMMCIDKKNDMFTAGSKINAKLQFAKAGELPVTIEIRDNDINGSMNMQATPTP
jgi:copper(I)-binding protein